LSSLKTIYEEDGDEAAH